MPTFFGYDGERRCSHIWRVRVEFLRVDPIENLQVRTCRRTRLFLVMHALAEQVQRCRDASRIERADCGDRLVDRFPRDETRRHAAGKAISPDEREDSLLIREIEQRL